MLVNVIVRAHYAFEQGEIEEPEPGRESSRQSAIARWAGSYNSN